jgi:Tetratricopeptide repeat/NB-ARC domain
VHERRRKLIALTGGCLLLVGGGSVGVILWVSSHPVDAAQVVGTVIAVMTAVGTGSAVLWRWAWGAGNRDLRNRSAKLAERSAHFSLGGEAPSTIWFAPARNHHFAGREDELSRLSEALSRRGRVAAQSVSGLSGVGKSSLAVEYAHRFKQEFNLVWWIDAESPSLVGEQLRQLALTLGVNEEGSSVSQAINSCHRALQNRTRWLLVFDNAEDPEPLLSYLPSGPGQILITTRDSRWGQVSEIITLDVMKRSESIKLLVSSVPKINRAAAGVIAHEVGDLPLAVVQAGTLMAESGMSAQEYLALYKQEAGSLLAEGVPVRYGRSLATVTLLVTTKIETKSPLGLRILGLMSVLAPARVPMQWLEAFCGEGALRTRGAVALLRRYGIMRLTTQGDPTLHRAISAVVRDSFSAEALQQVRHDAVKFVTSVAPASAEDPDSWVIWTVLTPHVFALIPAQSKSSELRRCAILACWNLMERGNSKATVHFARQLAEGWATSLGPIDPETIEAGIVLARAYGDLGDYVAAKAIGEVNLGHLLRLRGPDDVTTLKVAHSLALCLRGLGDVEAACTLDRDTWERRKKTLGERDSETLRSAHNLAIDLRTLGSLDEAEALDRRTLDVRIDTLGLKHPHSLASAVNLARDIHEKGAIEQARKLNEETLPNCKEVLGANHPFTLACAHNLAMDYTELGLLDMARPLAKDVLARRSRVSGTKHPYTRESRALSDRLGLESS